jgi:hypothetical protein
LTLLLFYLASKGFVACFAVTLPLVLKQPEIKHATEPWNTKVASTVPSSNIIFACEKENDSYRAAEYRSSLEVELASNST